MHGELELIFSLRKIVGRSHVLTQNGQTRRYRIGYRRGSGSVTAVVRPRSLVELWRVFAACIAAQQIVIVQAANTGLTGGSTPDGDQYDRGVVIVSTLRITGIHLLDEGRKTICLPGTTLPQLEAALRPFGREPHSVIGSSCIGASVHGGICNGSGGALIARGPAYTELALFARVNASGDIELVNHLGVDLGDEPETMLRRLERGDFTEGSAMATRRATDQDYANHVRDIDADTPARYNADPRRLFEASGCAGRIVLFAVALDTFAAPASTAVFYIGTNDPRTLSRLRRDMLSMFARLPVSAEYLNRTAFEVAANYGKDAFLLIRWLGPRRIGAMLRVKGGLLRLAAILGARPQSMDAALLWIGRHLKPHLPKRLTMWHDRFDHHLILKCADDGIDEAREYLGHWRDGVDHDFFECTPAEGEAALLHRFVTASAAIRYRDMHADAVEDIVAIDVALRRNDSEWWRSPRAVVAEAILHALDYGHFFCHVFHRDYIIRRGSNSAEVKRLLLADLAQRGARYPAEHNVGHEYPADLEQIAHFKALDPGNHMNAGIGQTSKNIGWQ